jgi:cytochrome oxidase assembly protein ShyY1
VRAREQDKAAANKAAGGKVTVTAVVDDQTPRDTLDLLEDSEVQTWQASKLEDLALALRAGLGL